MTALSQRFRTALVTGASGGLGAAFVEMLLQEGVAVWGTARSLDRLKLWQNRNGFFPQVLDLTDPAPLDEALKNAAQEAEGFFDLVVNNAAFGVFGDFSKTPFSVWRDQLNISLLGVAQVAHFAVAGMRARSSGTLVNVSSVAVDYPLPYMSGYNIAKAGLSALSESLIFEGRGSGVSVIDFRPGDFRTPFNSSMQASSIPFAPGENPRMARCWAILEKNLAGAPAPARAARDLRRALLSGKSGIVYSGSFFQTRLAPIFSRLAPAGLRRAAAARFFGTV